MTKNEIIDNAVKAASTAIVTKIESSTQINSFLTMIQGDKSDFGVKKLMLYITRQMNREKNRQPIVHPKFGSRLLEDMSNYLKEENPSQIVISYLTYVKWAYEAMNKKLKITNELSGLNDLVKKVKSI